MIEHYKLKAVDAEQLRTKLKDLVHMPEPPRQPAEPAPEPEPATVTMTRSDSSTLIGVSLRSRTQTMLLLTRCSLHLSIGGGAATDAASKKRITAKENAIKKARKFHDEKVKRLQESQQVNLASTSLQPFCSHLPPSFSSRPRGMNSRGKHRKLRRKFKS